MAVRAACEGRREVQEGQRDGEGEGVAHRATWDSTADDTTRQPPNQDTVSTMK